MDRDYWQLPSEQDIVNCYEGGDVKLRAEDVILNVSRGCISHHALSAPSWQALVHRGGGEGSKHICHVLC